MISRLFVCILISFLLPRYIIVFSIEFTLSEIYLNLKLALRKFSGPHSNTYDYSIYCYFYILQLTSFNGIWKIKKHDWPVLLHFFEISRSWLKSVFYKRTGMSHSLKRCDCGVTFYTYLSLAFQIQGP